MGSYINVSPETLLFLKNEPSTQVIDLETSAFKLTTNHSLPKSFTFELMKSSACNYKIVVNYDGSSVEQTPKQMAIIIYDANRLFGVVLSAHVLVNIVDEIINIAPTPAPTLTMRSEALECKICMLEYSEKDQDLTPRMLPGCGHTLCEKCIKTLMQQHGNRSVHCPFDRKVTQCPQFATDMSFVPKNFAILEMLQEENEVQKKNIKETMEKTSETEICEDPDVPCFENSKHEATFYCTTCKEDFCKSCFESTHSSSKIFSRHKTVPVSEKPIVHPTCSKHPNDLANFLCKDKNCQIKTKLACAQCFNNEHKNHHHVSLIEEMTKKEKALEEIISKLKAVEAKFQKMIETAQNCAHSFEMSNSTYTKKVESINKYFDGKKKEALEKLKNFVVSEKEKLELGRNQGEHDLLLLTGIRREIEKTLKKKTNFHNSDEIIEKGEAMCSLDGWNDGDILPFSSYSLPDDMSIL